MPLWCGQGQLHLFIVIHLQFLLANEMKFIKIPCLISLEISRKTAGCIYTKILTSQNTFMHKVTLLSGGMLWNLWQGQVCRF
jgi:hypothetical protein